MTTLADKNYLPDFFTPERLAWYRKLTERFPLWCGHWPEDHASSPEWVPWCPSHYIGRVIERAEVELPDKSSMLGHWFEQPSADRCPPLTLVVEQFHDWTTREDGDRFPLSTQRRIHPGKSATVTWLSALNYIAYRWDDDEPIQPIKPHRFAETVSELVEATADVLSQRFGRGGRLLRLRRKVMEAASREEREDAIQQLKSAWRTIGREVGVLPDVQGGPRSTLDSHFLARLLDEAGELVETLRSFEPSNREIESVRRLERIEDALSENEQAHVDALQDRDPNRAEEVLDRKLREIDRAYGIPTWVTVLRFPMLCTDEVEMIGRERQPLTTAKKLVSGRLPGLAPKTILNNTSPFRQHRSHELLPAKDRPRSS